MDEKLQLLGIVIKVRNYFYYFYYIDFQKPSPKIPLYVYAGMDKRAVVKITLPRTYMYKCFQ